MEKTRKKEEEEEEEQAMEGLPNDLLREILSRVPYRSLCRLKCVSPAWLALCSDPAVRRRSPQTLSGFFGDSPSGTTRFLNLSGRGWPLVDPSLPFLRGFENVKLLGCCGGILLCHGTRAWRAEYIVCNPATQEIWAALPVPRRHGPPPEPHIRGSTISLCFDPVAVPSRFAVFVIIDGGHGITAMEVYSSDDAAGEWTSVSSRWGHQMRIGSPSRRMRWYPWTSCESGYFFLDGTLHFIAYDSGEDTINLIVTVDMDGSTWRTIRQPPKVKLTFIGHSQGRLHGTEMDRDNGCRLSVWVLENYAGGGQWTLKHTASILELLGRPCLSPYFTLVAIHPEHDQIFLDAWVESTQALMSYDMGTQKLQVICSLENYPMQNLRPHVPCFVEWPPSDAH